MDKPTRQPLEASFEVALQLWLGSYEQNASDPDAGQDYILVVDAYRLLSAVDDNIQQYRKELSQWRKARSQQESK